ncbi:MAG: hypothetical protein NZ960_06310 [Candidatus Kapabacteria bacterium]|nr:hypothetical protein [Candidatus Kapabacteria bacterium]MDW8011379.1 hypothetical protein [Bacteroidota bacterium]
MVVKALVSVLLLALPSAAQLLLKSGVSAIQVAPGWEANAPATLVNSGSQPLQVIVEMDTSDMTFGCAPYFCWGPSCYAPGVTVSPDTVTIAPGAEEKSFKAYVYVEASTPEARATLRFRFRDANSGAVLYAHTVEVTITPAPPEGVGLVWAQTVLIPPPEGEISGGAALYNNSRELRRLLVQLVPTDIPPSAIRFCLGDTCYEPGRLTATDTLVLRPRQLYTGFQCWLRAAGTQQSRILLVRFFDAVASEPVAEYQLGLALPTAVLPERPSLDCSPLSQRWVRSGSALPQLPQGAILEIFTLRGQRLLQSSDPSSLADALRNLPPRPYAYRLRRAEGTVCTGLLLVD